MMRLRREAWHPHALVLAVMFAPGAASAQVAGCNGGETDLFARGIEMLQAHRPGEAVALLEAACFCSPEPRMLYNLAIAYEGVARYLEAAESYERFLRDRGPTLPEDTAREVRERLERMRRRLGLLIVRRVPDGAVVSIGGHARTVFANGLYVNPGVNLLEVRAEGYQSLRRELRVAAGARVELDLEMPRAATTTLQAPEAEVSLDVHPPSAEVTLDGHMLGQGNLQRRVAEGRHVIEVRARGYRPELRAVEIVRGVVQQYVIELEPEARPDDGGVTRRWWFWTIVGGVVLAGGVTAALAATAVERSGHISTDGAMTVEVP